MKKLTFIDVIFGITIVLVIAALLGVIIYQYSLLKNERRINNKCCECSEPVKEVNKITYIEMSDSIKESIEPRYGFTDEEIYILAQLLCGDESYDGDGEYDFVYGALHDNMRYDEMSKVLCVIMNRVRHEDFPNKVSEVIFQSGQFADYRRIDTEPAAIAIEKIREWCEAYDRWDPGVQNIPENHLYFEAGPNLTNVTKEE